MSDRRDPLEGLSPVARRAVLQELQATASRRVRDLLAAAAGDDRAAVIRLATALGSDLAGLDMEEVRAAAAALAESARDQPLGAPVMALARAYQAASVRLRLARRPGPSS